MEKRCSRKADPRFGRWVDSVIIETSASAAAVARELHIDPRDLRRIRRGVVAPPAKKTYDIGEALHACGVEWCSGPLALFHSTHLPELVDFIAALAAADLRQAGTLITALALVDDGRPLRDEHKAIFGLLQEPAATVFARQQLAEMRAFGSRTAAKNQRDAAPDLKVARIFAIAGDRQRMIVALVEWAVRTPSALADDTLYARRAAAFAKAEVSWAGPARASCFADIFALYTNPLKRALIGVGRGKNVSP